MEWTGEQLGALFPALTAQIRGTLSNLALAVREVLPEEEREASPEKDRKAARMDQSYYVLLRLLDNIANTDWLLGKRTPRRQSCEIVRMVSDICVESADLFRDQGKTLSFKVPAKEHVCMADPGAIRTALFHLLSNALKFTPVGGQVSVELRLRGGQVLLSVTNSGDGLSDEFVRFLSDNGTNPPSPPPHGLGLGLPLCRAIAEAHGGRLLAESRAGKQCRMTLSFPDEGGVVLRDPCPVLYNDGFNKTLLGLADALPASAFCLRGQE